jgi:signal transduction histidine kinase
VGEEIIRQADDPEAVLWEILEQALLLTAAEQGELHLYRNGKPHITYFALKQDEKVARREKRERARSKEIDRGIVRYVAENLIAYRTGEDAQIDAHYSPKASAGKAIIHSEIAVPLLAGNELIGILRLESVTYDDLTEADIDLMQLLAGQAVIAYQNALRYRQEQEATRRFRTLRDVGKRLSEITTFEEVEQAYNIVAEPLEKFSTGWTIIRRYDEEKQELHCVWLLGPMEGRSGFAPRKLGEGTSGYVAQRWLSGEDRSGKALVIADVNNPPPGVRPQPVSYMVRSLVSAPVFFKEKYYGNLALSHDTVDYFKDEDVVLIEGLAEQLGVTLRRLEVTRAQQEAERQLEEDRARAKNREAMALYAANVAHRYGNIFRPVLTQANKLLSALKGQGQFGPEVEERLNEFIRRADKASKLNKQFKDFSHTIREVTTSGEPPDVFVLHQLLADVLADQSSHEQDSEEERLEGQSSSRYDYEFEFDDDVGHVKAVSDQIKDVLSNLIGNALEAMPEGGKLSFKARNLDKHVELRITDNGPGIPPDVRPKIFDYGYSNKGSTGFGLSIAQYYASTNGGDLKLDENHQGPGTTFILLLPRADHS